MNSFIKCGLVFVAGCVVGTLSERNRDKIDPLVKALRDRAKNIIANRKPSEKGNGDLHSVTLVHTAKPDIELDLESDVVKEAMAKHRQFLDLYEALKMKEVPYIPFDMKWNNGTGYLNGVVEDLATIPQGFSTSVDALTNRKCIIHRNDHNIVVVFERYRDGFASVLVHNGALEGINRAHDVLDKFIEFYAAEHGQQ